MLNVFLVNKFFKVNGSYFLKDQHILLEKYTAEHLKICLDSIHIIKFRSNLVENFLLNVVWAAFSS